MRYLLDTHAALWWFEGSRRFKKSVRDSLMDRANAVFISAVSTWEISIKVAIGKLVLPQDPRVYIAPRIVRAGFSLLPVLAEHTYEAFSLPPHYLDPFDRLLIAQARIDDLSIVTADNVFAQYDVRRIVL
ncbi:MAG: type II toxin-antitoxin system VapC family toxin [Candidatus Eremiobacteraeota bacterium]|nr:type II toxin-antitoxin system VapC family toxin [Candidatus Eremiobacteraeota bacterium]